MRNGRAVAAVGNGLYAFDLRASEQVLIKECSLAAELGVEINEFALGDEFIALPCDEGPLLVLSASDFSLRSQLNAHTNIVACAELKDSELVSGGYDQMACRWDASTGKLRAKLDYTKAVKPVDGQLLNPPFVLNLKFGKNGTRLAGAMGDGSVLLWEYRGDRCNWQKPDVIKERHRAACSALDWWKDALLTAGNDQRLLYEGLEFGIPKPNAIDGQGEAALLASTDEVLIKVELRG